MREREGERDTTRRQAGSRPAGTKQSKCEGRVREKDDERVGQWIGVSGGRHEAIQPAKELAGVPRSLWWRLASARVYMHGRTHNARRDAPGVVVEDLRQEGVVQALVARVDDVSVDDGHQLGARVCRLCAREEREGGRRS